MYQLATEQYGCQHLAIRCMVRGFGITFMPYAFRIALRTP